METSTVIGRFAPSPTGRMHLGNVYAALLSWLSAKSQGGRWLLRIEDIDPQRSKPQFTEQLKDDLLWLGLNWDLYAVQSERYDRYEQALAQLPTYPYYKTRNERLVSGAPHLTDALQPSSEASASRKPAMAIRIGNEDIILRRSDGAWAYQLAVVVDDAEMGVTEVVRGRDLLDSVRYHHFLQDALDYSHPIYKHLPLLVNNDGQRLCKRDKALDMGELRKNYSPEQIIGRLAYLAGQTPAPDPISATDLLAVFNWNTIPQDDIYAYRNI